jgi:hypothetical protein
MATVQIGSRNIGDIVKITESGAAVNYIVAHKGASSSLYPAADFNDTVMVVRQDVLPNRAWNNPNSNDYVYDKIEI